MKYISSILAAGFMAMCTLPMGAAIADSIPASKPKPEAKAWMSNPDKPALMEALSRTPGHNFNEMFAGSPFKAMPLKGQVKSNPQLTEAITKVIKSAPRAIPGGTNLTAYMAYNTIDKPNGFYSIPLTSAGEFVEQSLLPTIESSGFHGGAITPYYAVFSYQGLYTVDGQYSCYTAIFDRRNWQMLGQAGDYGEYGRWASDMTFDPTTNRIYGCFMDDNASDWELGYMQIDDSNPGGTVNTIRKVNKLATSLNGIACDDQGVLWGIRNDNGALVTISRKTGELTTVASTGIVPRYNGTLAWDNSQHILYWTLCYDSGTEIRSALCTVDPETGKVEYINNFNGGALQLGALGADFVAKAGSPAPAANMKVNFNGFDYSGNVTFDVPAMLEDETAATGDVQANLVVTSSNRAEVFTASTTAAFGATDVTIPVTLENPGNYTFTMKLTNEVGASYPVSVTRYVGIDYPSPIEKVDIEYADGKVTVSWPAVTEPLYGGYFNPDELIYRVSVQKTDVTGQSSAIYSDNTADNKVEIPIEETTDLRAFRATVVPVVSDVAGQPFQTKWKWFGYYSAPFEDSMKTAGAWTTETIYGGSWTSTSSGWAIPYNWGVYNNSWLFSPAVKLEKGEVYNISMNAYADIVLHTGKLSMGSEPSSTDMTKDLCNLAITPKKTNTIDVVVTCEETGIYYFGILNDTQSDTWTNYPNVYFTNFKVEPVSHDAPAASEMTVTRDPKGGYIVPISVTIPTKTHGGNELTGDLSFELKRGSNVIFEKESVQPGEVVEFTDEVSDDGSYTYFAIVTNDVAAGVPATETVFIGAGLPINPSWVRSSEGDEIGTVKASWAPVTENVMGMEIAPEALTYNVMNILQDIYIERGLTDTNYSYRACDEGEQEGVYITVNAQTNSGTSSLYGTYSQDGIVFVGTPASLPMRENFAPDTQLSVPWLTVNQSSGADGFKVADMMAEEGIMDANGDGYGLLGFCPYHDGSVCLYSGNIEIPADATAPALYYAVLNTNFGRDDNCNENEVSIYIIGEKTSGLVDKYKINSMPLGWNYRYIDLGSLKGQKVHIMIQLHTLSFTTYYFDDICLYDRKTADLEVQSVNVSPTVDPDTRFRVSVKVLNNGVTATTDSDATVELYRGDKLLSSHTIPALKSLNSYSTTFYDRLQLADAPGAEYTARVVYGKDVNAENDEMKASTKIVLPVVPTPSDIVGEPDANGYPEISWVAPDLTPVYEPTLAHFEEFQGYSLVHLSGFSTFEMTRNVKDISNFETAHGFELYYHPQLSHSGNCFLASTACKDGAAKEDWLVSPALSGHAQTVSFYVCTNWDAHENFYVYTSTSGDLIEDFGEKPAYTGRTLSNNWEQISIDLPEGTKHFAIVAKAEDTSELMMLMIDDVVYEGLPENADLDLKGFRVYRDRESISTDPIEDMKVVDNEAAVGGHLYRVSALYDGIESAPTDEIYVFSRGGASSDIETLEFNGVKVFTKPGLLKIVADGDASIMLVDYNGHSIYQGTIHNGEASIPVDNGMYVLNINGTSIRIMIK
ncbi:MAG: hypothetical protein K2M93_08025 [Muribaculaceae bacterium]|nr:hypothetical protein [Muribaculaceae bacterium]